MAPKFSKNMLDLKVGAKSWRPGGAPGTESGGIAGSRGRWVSSPATVTSNSSSSALDDADAARVHFLSPGGGSGRQSPSLSTSSIGRSFTPMTTTMMMNNGRDDDEFERQAKELAGAQAAQEAATRAQALAQQAAEAEKRIADAERSQREIDELQEQRMVELLNARQELAEREREVKEKEDRIATLVRQEEERAQEEIRRMQEQARREDEQRRARLEALEREDQERRERLERLDRQREEERAKAAEEELCRRLEEEKRRLEEEERLAIEDRIRREKEDQERAKKVLRAEIQAREQAAYARNAKRRNQLLTIANQTTRPIPRVEPKLQPVSYARYVRSPSVGSIDLPLSPAYHLDVPVAVPDDVRKAAEARRREYEVLLVEAAEAKAKELTARRAEEERRQLAESEAREAQERRSALSSSRASSSKASTSRASSATRETDRRRSAGSSKRSSTESSKSRRKSTEEDRRLRAAAEELKRRREAEEESRIRGAEMAAYFMARQDLRRPRRPSLSRSALSDSVQKRALSPEPNPRMPAPDAIHASAPIGRINSPPLLGRTGRQASMMGPKPGLASDAESTPKSEADASAMFIVVSADSVIGYSHDVLELVKSSATTNVAKTPAMAFISGTGAGKNEEREGKRAAVEKLVQAAEQLGADAIISLRLQSPKAISDTEVEFTASGVAVRLQMPSPERLPLRSTSPFTFPNSRCGAPLTHVASAPVGGLRTPSTAFGSPSEDSLATPKASATGLPALPEGLLRSAASPPALPLPPPTPEEVTLTPRGMSLPDSPVFSDVGTPKRTKPSRMGRTPRIVDELWIGDDWAETSPAMQMLKSPMAPAPLDLALKNGKGGESHSHFHSGRARGLIDGADAAPLIDLGDDRDLNAVRERAQNTMPCWEGIGSFAA